MRTAALAHLVILAAVLGGPVLAQDRLAPDVSPPEVQTAPVPAPAPEPDLSAPRILSVPDAPTSSITQQPAEPAPKVQDRADTKGDLLPPAAAAAAAAPTPPPPETRFTFRRVHGGFVRLDGQTGQIAHCAPRDAGGWFCQTVPEGSAPLATELTQLGGDVSGLKDQVTGLADEVTGLKGEVSGLKSEVSALNEQIAALTKEVQALRPPPPPVPPAPVPPDKTQDETLKVPSREDLARARDYVREKAQDTWRRLVEMIGDFQRDVLGEI